MLFWDPSRQGQYHTQYPQVDSRVHYEDNQAILKKLERNHFHGSQSFANYGYASINGVWVDPDNPQGIVYALTEPKQLSPPEPLPNLAEGPLIMNAREEDLFYKEYVNDVVEGGDCEGDPRNLRISPSTFAQWAVGARFGDYYPSFVPVPKVSLLKIYLS